MTAGRTVRWWAGVGIIVVGCVGLVATPGRPAPARPVVIGFIGDSITADYGVPAAVGQLLTSSRRPVGVLNRGVAGSRSAQWLPGARPALLGPALRAFHRAGVHVVHVMLGTNDARPNWRTTPVVYAAHMAQVCRALRAAGFVPVVSASPFVVPGAYRGTPWATDAATDRFLQAYRPALRGLVARGPCQGGDSASYGLFARHPAWLWDGLHPGPAGTAALARLWAPPLARALDETHTEQSGDTR